MKGLAGAYVAYPLAQKIEKREVSKKLREMRKFYSDNFENRSRLSLKNLERIIEFSKHHVPYYKDLFNSINFEPSKVCKDPKYLNEIPFLTKEIILEQGSRLLSSDLEITRHYPCKTGGSTGKSCIIYYDQEAADYSSATTLYCRETVGNRKFSPELHFACRFPNQELIKWPSREDFKCFAMNRTNIFFDKLDDDSLDAIWKTLNRRKPYMAHAHPSTMYALACYVGNKYGSTNAFKVFESSGELLTSSMRKTIAENLKCCVVDRYGLAELGVMAYELDRFGNGLQFLDSEGWAEAISFDGAEKNERELVFTGFRNYLMPLIRYRTGDLANICISESGVFLTNLTGRIHDIIKINGIDHATHYVQDILDHKVGGIQEFQIDLRTTPATLKILPENYERIDEIKKKLKHIWNTSFKIEFVNNDDFVRVGRHSKFRHVVH